MWSKIILATLVLVNILLIWAILGGSHGLQSYRRQKEVLGQVQSRLEQVREDNVRLSRRIRLLKKDTQYLEQMVRTRLHYVKGNEIIYLPAKKQASAGKQTTLPR
ncbi:FtsB family cell division protein [Desulfovermiculus halophilus]|uniref:FtsB family cell division protein n=1 Tax=Desulfovermiculus halophilus TaxID=339722 RepID=UPI0006878AD4|nr:septum formation initiator family protein [Desulfovermiculus halophilus]